MKLTVHGNVTKIRPAKDGEREMLIALTGSSGFAVMKLKTDSIGIYLEVIPTNPKTMEPWEIVGHTTLPDGRMVAHGKETRTTGDDKG